MNYEMPSQRPPVILKQRAMKRGGGGAPAPVAPSPRPAVGEAGTQVGKSGLPGLAVDGTGPDASQRTGRMPWQR